MATMPNLVGLNLTQAIVTLIEADIIANEGLVPTVDNPPGTVGYFDPWPVSVVWEKGTPVNQVTAQSPASGQSITVNLALNAENAYTPPITLTVNAPTMGVSSQFTAGGYT